MTVVWTILGGLGLAVSFVIVWCAVIVAGAWALHKVTVSPWSAPPEHR